MKTYCGSSVEEMLAYRSSVYELLRRVFLWQFPQELFIDLVNASRGGQVDSRLPEAPLQTYLSSLPDHGLEQVYRELHIEYTRLFIGPHHLPAPPYESVYRNATRLMMQDETIDVRLFYAKHGFRVTRITQVPDDNIGIELEFMLAMSIATRDALARNHLPKLTGLIEAQRQFLDAHLLKWAPKFCQDIVENSTSEFWKSAAAFTRKFLDEDAVALLQIRKAIESAA